MFSLLNQARQLKHFAYTFCSELFFCVTTLKPHLTRWTTHFLNPKRRPKMEFLLSPCIPRAQPCLFPVSYFLANLFYPPLPVQSSTSRIKQRTSSPLRQNQNNFGFSFASVIKPVCIHCIYTVQEYNIFTC